MARERTNQTWWVGVNSLFSAVILLCFGLFFAGCGSDSVGSNGTVDGGSDARSADVGMVDDDVSDAADVGSDAVGPIDMSATEDQVGPPCIGFELTGIRFGPARVGEVKRRLMTLRNCSERASLNVTSVRMEDDPSEVFSFDFGELPGPSFVLGPSEVANFDVLFEPDAGRGYSGTLVVESDDPFYDRIHFPVEGTGIDSMCPVTVATATSGASSGSTLTIDPLSTVSLDGSMSSFPNGPIDSWEWSIISRPPGSNARLEPARDVVDPEIWIDLVGTYVLHLEVDSNGKSTCSEPATVTIHAMPTQDVYVQLTWHAPALQTVAPGANGVDFNLHYLRDHPDAHWNEQPWSVFWNQKSAAWGGSQVELANESINQLEPEVITHDSPEQGVVHRVGVDYHAALGNQSSLPLEGYATVEIYFDGVLAFDDRDTFIGNVGQFLEVAEFAGGSSTVTKLGGITDGFP